MRRTVTGLRGLNALTGLRGLNALTGLRGLNALTSVALASAVALGMRDTFRPEDPIPIVVDYAGEPPELGPVTVFFHPQVPEATLVLVQT